MNSKEINKTLFNKSSIGGGNSLNTIRLLAALHVFFTHATSWLQLQRPDVWNAVSPLFWGVPIFFVLSGFLIWNSLDKTPDYKSYCKKRVLRLYPELWLGLFVSICCILVLYDGWNIKDMLVYTMTQATFFQFWTPDSLRGYGVGNPNGSLWAVCTIIQFYFVVFFIKKVMNKSSNIVSWLVLLVVSIAMSKAVSLISPHLPVTVAKLLGISIFADLWMFLFGSFLAAYAYRVLPFLKQTWCVPLLLLIAVVCTGFDIETSHYPVLQTYLIGVTWIGFAYAFPRLNIKYDISYGIYIMHMIVINVFVHLGYTGSWLYLFLVLVISVSLATFSYLTVGRTAMNMKKGLTHDILHP